MASTFSPLKIELIATGEQSGTWGTTTNVNLGTALEEAITGSADVTFASGNVTVTLTDVNTTQIARNLRLNLVGTSSGTHSLILGSGCNIEKLYLVNNTLANDITVGNTAGGSSVTVPAGKSMFVYNTGTNVVDAITHINNASGTFTSLNVTGNTTLGDASADTITLNGTVQPGVVVSGSSSGDAFRITQTGTGNAFVVEDSASPDSTPFVIDAAGNVVVGYTSTTNYAAFNPNVQSQMASQNAGFAAGNWQNTSGAPNIWLGKSRGAIGTHTIVQSGDGMGNIRFYGSDGTGFIESAAIYSFVDGTPGTNDMPGRLVFSTTADGASSPTERMRINSAGEVGIGASSGTGLNLLVGKNITGATSAVGISISSQAQSDVTTRVSGIQTNLSTQATSYTLATLQHYRANQSTIGAGSTVTNQFGFVSESTLIGATNNYGFYSNIASGTGRWNFYANGTANNFFNGLTGIGASATTLDADVALQVKTSSSGRAWAANGNLDILTESSSITGVHLISGNTSQGRIWFSDTDAEVQGALNYDHSDNSMRFLTTGTERMRIDNAGNVGINCTPDSKFVVESGTQFAIASARTTTSILARGTGTAGAGAYGGAITFAQISSSRPWGAIAGVQYSTDVDQGGLAFFYKSSASSNDTVVEGMRLDAAGNVGIGVAPYDSNVGLTVYRSQNSLLYQDVQNPNTGSGAGAIFRLISSNAAGSGTASADFVKYKTGFLVINNNETNSAAYTSFGVGASERMRIDSSGNLLVGTTSVTGKFTAETASTTQRTIHAGSSSGSITTDGIIYSYTNTTSGTGFNHFAAQSGSSGLVFRVLGTGTVQNTTGTYTTISDAKLKENIVDIAPQLERLMNVRVVNYNLIGDELKQAGWIAQELETVYPKLVFETPDRDENGEMNGEYTKGVKQSVFIPLLVKALQELKAELDVVKAELNTLKGN